MAIKIASVAQTRAIEAAADQAGITYARMMLEAGRAASDFLQARLPVDADATVLFLIGKGNNGGDGLVMALDLASKTPADIRLYLLEARDDLHFMAAKDAGIVSVVASDDSDHKILRAWTREATVIVDALFGIGVRLPLRGRAAWLLAGVKRKLEANPQEAGESTFASASQFTTRAQTSPYVLAIDCPSGVDCDDGSVDEHALQADATLAFIAAKRGTLEFPAAGLVGELVVAPAGLPDELPALAELSTSLVDWQLARALLPPRPQSGHKGSFGKAIIVAGSPNYIGALSLAGEAAGRSGAGLVTVATTRALIDCVAGSLREPTWLPLPEDDGAICEGAAPVVIEAARGYQAMLVGCGLGLHESTRAFTRRIAAAQSLPALVLDADALNALSQQDAWWERLPAETIITPHIGEMARLTGLTTAQINSDRLDVALSCAARWQVTVLLKGAHSIVAEPGGAASIMPFKTDALGTAGTGDILAGLIIGLRAQGTNAYDCARLGAWLHGLAGTIAAEQVGSSRSVIAGDVLAALGEAFRRLEAS